MWRLMILVQKKASQIQEFSWSGFEFLHSRGARLATTKSPKTGSEVHCLTMFPSTDPGWILMCPFVMCLPSPPRVMPGHLWTLHNPVEPGRTMTWWDRKSNEAWNQYVQSCLTRGMLGNGVSGVLWSRFNHWDLGLSTRKQAGYCRNNTTLSSGRACAPLITLATAESAHSYVYTCGAVYLSNLSQSSVPLVFNTATDPDADPACEVRASSS